MVHAMFFGRFLRIGPSSCKEMAKFCPDSIILIGCGVVKPRPPNRNGRIVISSKWRLSFRDVQLRFQKVYNHGKRSRISLDTTPITTVISTSNMQSRDNVMMTHIVRSISKPKTDLVLQSLYEFWFVVPRPSKPNFLLRVSNIFKHLQKLISASAIIILSRHNEQSSVPTRHDSNPFGSQWGSWLLTYSHLLHACNIYKHVHPKSSTSKELFQHHETYVPWSMVKSQALVWGIVTAPSKSSMAYHGQYANYSIGVLRNSWHVWHGVLWWSDVSHPNLMWLDHGSYIITQISIIMFYWRYTHGWWCMSHHVPII